MPSEYLAPGAITQARRTETPCWGRTADGYTRQRGAPTSIMVRLAGERRWRRLMSWCWSNAGTLFVRVSGRPLIVNESDQPALTNPQP